MRNGPFRARSLWTALTSVRKEVYPSRRTYVRPRPDPDWRRHADHAPRADRTPAGDLAVPRPVRGRPWLPADRPRDRRRRRARLAVDRARPPSEPRASRAPQARPDEAEGDRAHRK